MSATSLPKQVLSWAQGRLPSAIRDAEPLGGGITRTKWLLRFHHADPVVLRWADPVVWGEVGREHVRREALATRLLAGTALPVPRLIAVDPDGTEAGGPASLLSWCPGEVRLEPPGPTATAALAAVAVAVHRQPVATRARPPAVTLRGPAEPVVPDWSARPDLWRAAIALRSAPAPEVASGLLHRDFHFGNIVWQGEAVGGLVDWAETSWGPPELDVAHLCSDFAMLHTAAAADAFRTAYGAAGGDLDPAATRFWQVADIVGFLPDPAHILPGLAHLRPDLTAGRVRAGLEELLAQIL